MTFAPKPRKSFEQQVLALHVELNATVADFYRELKELCAKQGKKLAPAPTPAKSDCDCESEIQGDRYVRLYCEPCRLEQEGE